MNVKYYKYYINKLINTLPSTINITRTNIISDGYGGHTNEIQEFTEVVAFYDKKNRIEIINDSGSGYSGSSPSRILAKSGANIKTGDYFTIEGREYKVLYVKPYLDICLQVEIEVVKDEG